MIGFYEVDKLDQIAINLFYGWGYNFYRQENQLRQDDQTIRAKVGWLLGSARKSVETAERDYRRDFLPPLSREKPRHEPEAIANAQVLERLSKGIGSLVTLMSAQPAPENDRMSQRYRNEAETLKKLIASDQLLTGQAELLRSSVDGREGKWIVENASDLQEGIKAIGETLRQRQGLLM